MSDVEAVVDLHAHSRHSDGWLRPRDVIAQQSARGVVLTSLTDHDTFDGTAEASNQAAVRGMEYVVGVEITCAPGRADLHVLAHGADPDDAGLADLLERNRAIWAAQSEAVAAALVDAGARRLWDGPAQGWRMPHAVVRAYVAAREVAFDAAWSVACDTIRSLPDAVFGTMPTLAEVADAVHACGGMLVWAHPGRCTSPETAIGQLSRFDAVEAASRHHTDAQVALYTELAVRNHLYLSAGSDFHGVPRYRVPAAVASSYVAVLRAADKILPPVPPIVEEAVP